MLTTNRAAAVVVSVLVSVVLGANGQTIIYVDDDALLGGDGTSWNTAFTYLQDALAVATNGDQIRVAVGTYEPDQDEAGIVTPGDRTESFQLISGVGLYGGYRGCPTGNCGDGDPDERDLVAYESILSGDLEGDDEPETLERFVLCYTGSNGIVPPWCVELDYNRDGRVDGDDLDVLLTFHFFEENSYHVVTGSGANATAVLHGFTVRAGNANDDSIPHDAGGGMRTAYGSPTLIDCTFAGNAGHFGGAMENFNGGNLTLIGCTFAFNTSTYRGGGMHNNTSHPNLVGCTFYANFAVNSSGGMRNWQNSNPTLTRCVFLGNRAGFGGGIVNDESDPTLYGCLFSGNAADGTSGGMHNWHSDPTLINCTFSENSAGTAGGGIYNTSGSSNPTLFNCILWGNHDQAGMTESSQLHGGAPLVRHSCIQGLAGLAGFGNIGNNPSFVDPGGADNTPGTEDDNLRLSEGSPCIDAGDNVVVTVGTDLDGLPRIVNGHAAWSATVDMGAYEYQPDCNDNGVSDALDIVNGASRDRFPRAWGGDGIPDECQTQAPAPR